MRDSPRLSSTVGVLEYLTQAPTPRPVNAGAVKSWSSRRPAADSHRNQRQESGVQAVTLDYLLMLNNIVFYVEL